jgi:hypothetical protein
VLGGAFASFGTGVTGVTRLIEMGTVVVVVPRTPLLDTCVFVTLIVASVDPIPRPVVLIVKVTVAPSGGREPLAGLTVMNGLSAVTVKVSAVSSASFPFIENPLTNKFCVMLQLVEQGGAARLNVEFVGGGGTVTSVVATVENTPATPLQIA